MIVDIAEEDGAITASATGLTSPIRLDDANAGRFFVVAAKRVDFSSIVRPWVTMREVLSQRCGPMPAKRRWRRPPRRPTRHGARSSIRRRLIKVADHSVPPMPLRMTTAAAARMLSGYASANVASALRALPAYSRAASGSRASRAARARSMA